MITQDDGRVPMTLDDPKLRAWRAFLHAHVAIMHELESQLVRQRGMTLAEYDALVQLAAAPGARLRMSELAGRVLLSRSGLTRLVDRLVAQGLVRREHCGSDARGSFAALTREGVRQLRAAMPVHVAGITELFVDVVDADDAAAIERAMTAVAATAGHPVLSPGRGGRGSHADEQAAEQQEPGPRGA
jgi:DNA-binding MarR family transcriptional regulator